jgi:hypothetical protein
MTSHNQGAKGSGVPSSDGIHGNCQNDEWAEEGPEVGQEIAWPQALPISTAAKCCGSAVTQSRPQQPNARQEDIQPAAMLKPCQPFLYQGSACLYELLKEIQIVAI